MSSMEQQKEVPVLPQITSLIKSYVRFYRTPSPKGVFFSL